MTSCYKRALQRSCVINRQSKSVLLVTTQHILYSAPRSVGFFAHKRRTRQSPCLPGRCTSEPLVITQHPGPHPRDHAYLINFWERGLNLNFKSVTLAVLMHSKFSFAKFCLQCQSREHIYLLYLVPQFVISNPETSIWSSAPEGSAPPDTHSESRWIKSDQCPLTSLF